MWSRLLLSVLGVFWVVMNLLLWRSEYTASGLTDFPVDPQIVWKKILTSPDSSSLTILHRGKRVGFCHLIASIVESPDRSGQTNAPEGMVRNVAHYKLDVSGSIGDLRNGKSLRLDGELTLSRSQEWESFRLQIIAQPMFMTIESKRGDGLVQLTIESPDLSTRKTFRLADLNQPQFLLTELFGDTALRTLDVLPLPIAATQSPTSRRRLQWNASSDRLMIGNSVTQVYRLELKPMTGYAVTILVSRAGEILRVELPEHVTGINEVLTAR